MSYLTFCTKGHQYVASDVYKNWPADKPKCPHCQKGEPPVSAVSVTREASLALADAIGLLWTTTPPTEPGHYWTWNTTWHSRPAMVHVYFSHQRGWEGTLRAALNGSFYTLDEFTHWLGPLPIPAPPTVTP
jgi:hypothetical protein